MELGIRLGEDNYSDLWTVPGESQSGGLVRTPCLASDGLLFRHPGVIMSEREPGGRGVCWWDLYRHNARRCLSMILG